jgi:hypothetical protein
MGTTSESAEPHSRDFVVSLENRKDLQDFFGVNATEFKQLIRANKFENEVGGTQNIDQPLELLLLIKASLEALFQPDEIKRWLRTPNPRFNRRTPVQAMIEGQMNRIWLTLIRLEEGIHS